MSSSVFERLTFKLYHAERNNKPIFPVMFQKVDFTSKEGKGIKLLLEGLQYILFQPGSDNYDSFFKKLIKSLRKKGICECNLLQFSSDVDNNI